MRLELSWYEVHSWSHHTYEPNLYVWIGKAKSLGNTFPTLLQQSCLFFLLSLTKGMVILGHTCILKLVLALSVKTTIYCSNIEFFLFCVPGHRRPHQTRSFRWVPRHSTSAWWFTNFSIPAWGILSCWGQWTFLWLTIDHKLSSVCILGVELELAAMEAHAEENH